MKKKNININQMLVVLCGLSLIFSSCMYEEIKDAEYPGQIIYMPAANSTAYDVSAVQTLDPAHPSAGEPFRFKIDEDNGEFIVPLGVYRSGIDKAGDLSVTITADEDAVAFLIDQGSLDSYRGGTDVAILSPAEYSLPTELNIPDGEGQGIFSLSVDLEFLRANPDTSYALAVAISSNDREVNPELSTTVVFIPAGIAD